MIFCVQLVPFIAKWRGSCRGSIAPPTLFKFLLAWFSSFFFFFFFNRSMTLFSCFTNRFGWIGYFLAISQGDKIPYPCPTPLTLPLFQPWLGLWQEQVQQWWPWPQGHQPQRQKDQPRRPEPLQWEGVIGLCRQNQDPLVSINDRKGHWCHSWVACLQTYTDNIVDTV